MDICPLRKRTRKGALYTRPPDIEHLIIETLRLPLEELLERAVHRNRKHSKYLPSEILVYRIRATRHNNTDEQFNALYPLLHERIHLSCPSALTQANGRKGVVGKLLDVREDVFDRFLTLLLRDRDGYAENLDFFEVKFERAVSLLKKSAFRKVNRREDPLIPLEYDEREEISKADEEEFSLLNPARMTREEEFTYRFQVRQAIDSLPEMERRVIDLLEAEVPIESKKPNEPSIARLLGCTPKTVRNRRARAIRRIREILGLEGADAN